MNGPATNVQEDLSWERTRLLMRRPWLDDLPGFPSPPEGFVLRRYQAGDRPALASLLACAFEEPWSEDLVEERLASAPDVEAIYVVAGGNRLIATASARVMLDHYPGAGCVHWVGAHPEFQGRGLGTLVTLRVLEHFRAAGLESAVLETSTIRLAAQRTYLRMGFIPEPVDREEQRRWARVLPLHLRGGEGRR